MWKPQKSFRKKLDCPSCHNKGCVVTEIERDEPITEESKAGYKTNVRRTKKVFRKLDKPRCEICKQEFPKEAFV